MILTYLAVTGLNVFKTGVKWSQFPVKVYGGNDSEIIPPLSMNSHLVSAESWWRKMGVKPKRNQHLLSIKAHCKKADEEMAEIMRNNSVQLVFNAT